MKQKNTPMLVYRNGVLHVINNGSNSISVESEEGAYHQAYAPTSCFHKWHMLKRQFAMGIFVGRSKAPIAMQVQYINT